MSDRLPQPLLDLQAVLAGAEATLQSIVAEVAAARARAVPLLPPEDFVDDTSDVPGLSGWALSLDGSAAELMTTLCQSALVDLDRARRSSPAEPSPRPWAWVGQQALAAARMRSGMLEADNGAQAQSSTGTESAG